MTQYEHFRYNNFAYIWYSIEWVPVPIPIDMVRTYDCKNSQLWLCV